MHGARERAGFKEPPVQKTPVFRLSVLWTYSHTRRHLPTSSAMNRDKPMPMGARKVPSCFSAASMKIVKVNCAVKSISITTPCAGVVPPPSVIPTLRPPWKSPYTIYEAMIVPTVCVTQRRAQRVQVIAPMSAIPREISKTLVSIDSSWRTVKIGMQWMGCEHITGLNKPLLIRKKV